VESVGAGLNVAGAPSASAIADAVKGVLADGSYGKRAAHIAEESRRAGGSAAAAVDLEALIR
jgi:UDP:flavonoid glycosyltransferase YjiC (YdhE family)